jgi:hypothetical protein
MLVGEKQWIPPSPPADLSAQIASEAHLRGCRVSWIGWGEIQGEAPMLVGEKQWIPPSLPADLSA